MRSGNPSHPKPRVWRRLLAGWHAVAGRFAGVQTLVILGLFYVVLIGPLAFAARLGRCDYLQKHRLPSGGSGWNEAEAAAPDLERARLTS
ncbi:MAG: hypothetical protein OEM49_12260 [Myxococcales bacterium]|nr:hypothetical protein [Myxococcales bacterium]